MKVKVKSLSRFQLLATTWTAAYQAPPSMGFSRQEYWSGVPLPSPKLFTDHSKYIGLTSDDLDFLVYLSAIASFFILPSLCVYCASLCTLCQRYLLFIGEYKLCLKEIYLC